MTPTITGRSTVDELPGPDGRSPLSGDGASTGRLGDRLFGGARQGRRHPRRRHRRPGRHLPGRSRRCPALLEQQRQLPHLDGSGCPAAPSRASASSTCSGRPWSPRSSRWSSRCRSASRSPCSSPSTRRRWLRAAGRRHGRPAGRRALDRLRLLGPDHRRPVLHAGPAGVLNDGPRLDPALRRRRASAPRARLPSPASCWRSWSCRSSPRSPARCSTRCPPTHKEGALALGATQWEMIRTAVLPFGKPGVISASMLGLGRALGETIAVVILLSALELDGRVELVGLQRRLRPSPRRSPAAPASSTARRRPAPTSPPAWCCSC